MKKSSTVLIAAGALTLGLLGGSVSGYLTASSLNGGTQGGQEPAGVDGRDGQDGVDGRDGLPGLDGVQGPAGERGAPGADGADGADGKNGADGATGPAGPTGPIGPVGPQGPEGPAGPTGATGAQGPAGADAVYPIEIFQQSSQTAARSVANFTRVAGPADPLFSIQDGSVLHVEETGYYLIGVYYWLDGPSSGENVSLTLQNRKYYVGGGFWFPVHQILVAYPGPGFHWQDRYQTQLMYLEAGDRFRVVIDSDETGPYSSSYLLDLKFFVQKLS